jgi:hypothetical protein
VHLAGQAPTLLDGRGVAERGEEQGRVEVHDVGLEARRQVREGGVQAEGGGVETGERNPRDDRDRAGTAAQRSAKACASTTIVWCRNARSASSSASCTSSPVPLWSLMMGVSCSPRGTCTTSPRTGSSSCTALAIMAARVTGSNPRCSSSERPMSSRISDWALR